MATVARDRLARMLRGDVVGAFSVALTAGADVLSVEVDGVGPIAFPVSSAQARELVGLGQPARFGRGEDTLTDPDVRDTWEIPKTRGQPLSGSPVRPAEPARVPPRPRVHPAGAELARAEGRRRRARLPVAVGGRAGWI